MLSYMLSGRGSTTDSSLTAKDSPPTPLPFKNPDQLVTLWEAHAEIVESRDSMVDDSRT